MNTYSIITDKIVFGGNCIGKINGKTVFIPYSLPQERLKVKITQSYKDYDIAEIIEIIEPSKFRVIPPCPFYGKCGGCNMMHISTDYQQILRKEILKDCFTRNGINIPEIEVISGSSFNYRSRFQFYDGGLWSRAREEKISLTSCVIAETPINDWLCSTPQDLRPKGRCHVFGSIYCSSCSDDSNKKICVCIEPEKNNSIKKQNSKNKKLKTSRKIYSGTQFENENTISVNLLSKEIFFNGKGFFQSNMQVLEKTICAVKDGFYGNSILDMYAGCGTFSTFLSDNFYEVTLVEHNRDALVYAEKNMTGKKHSSFGLSGAKWTELNSEKSFDAVFIDPPRSGMEKEVCSYLCRGIAKQIRSLSCDPATHARDSKALISSGYKLDRLFLCDFYPHTSHIESLGVFSNEL